MDKSTGLTFPDPKDLFQYWLLVRESSFRQDENLVLCSRQPRGPLKQLANKGGDPSLTLSKNRHLCASIAVERSWARSPRVVGFRMATTH